MPNQPSHVLRISQFAESEADTFRLELSLDGAQFVRPPQFVFRLSPHDLEDVRWHPEDQRITRSTQTRRLRRAARRDGRVRGDNSSQRHGDHHVFLMLKDRFKQAGQRSGIRIAVPGKDDVPRNAVDETVLKRIMEFTGMTSQATKSRPTHLCTLGGDVVRFGNDLVTVRRSPARCAGC